MSITKKSVITYSKSLFQNVKSLKGDDIFDNSQKLAIGNIDLVPTVYVIGEELSIIRSTLLSSKKVKEFFDNPTYSEQQKLKVLLNIFPGITRPMKSFLKLLTERTHLYLLPEISEAFNALLSAFKNSTKVKIITASTLNESYGPLLLKTLKEVTGSNEVILNISYNPKLLGGLIVEYNSTSTDASVLKEFSLFFNGI